MAKIVFALIFILIITASIPPAVFAAVKPRPNPIPTNMGGFSITPTIGGYFFADSEHRDTTYLYGVKVGYDLIRKSFADSLGVEGTLNSFTTKSKTDASGATGYIFRLDAIYPFILSEKWVPFFAAGAGEIVINSVSNGDKSPLINYGAGVKYFLEDYLAVRVDSRHLIVYDGVNTRNNFEVGIGLSYYFGKERKKKTVPPPVKQIVKENVSLAKASAIPSLEDIEKKEEVKAGEVNLPEVKAEIPAPPLPLVPAIAVVPLLALESSAKPLFENAPAQAEEPVSPVFGNEENVILELSVRFDTDKSIIKPEYYMKLKQIADFMQRNPKASARIEGHTDSTGKLSHNIILSKQRSQSVLTWLVKLGINRERIVTLEYGPLRPKADNVTKEGRQKNRRSDVLVTIND